MTFEIPVSRKGETALDLYRRAVGIFSEATGVDDYFEGSTLMRQADTLAWKDLRPHTERGSDFYRTQRQCCNLCSEVYNEHRNEIRKVLTKRRRR